MTGVPEPTVRVASYIVSCLPEDTHNWDITVAYRGDAQWAVVRDNTFCLSAAGTWDYEHIPGERRDEWLAGHRFDVDTALKLAREQAQLVRVAGLNAQQALEWLADGKQL